MNFSEVSLNHYLILSALLFCLGIVGIVVRKNLLIVFMCIEVLMNSVNLAFVTLARYYAEKRGAEIVLDGHVVAILVMAIAAVEAAIGLGIVISLFRNRQTVNTSELKTMWG